MDNIYENLYMARSGDPQALALIIRKYESFIGGYMYNCSKRCYLLEGMCDDMIQEGKIVLMDAVYGYRDGKEAGFTTFLRLLLDRKVKNMIRSRKARKVIPPEQLVSLEKEVSDSDNYTVGMLLEQRDVFADPEFVLAYHEAMKVVSDTVQDMSRREKEALTHWMNDSSSSLAALAMNCSQRTYSVYTRRIRSRIKDNLHENREMIN